MIAIIDYNAGNLKSVERALKKLGHACLVTHDREEIRGAERVVFPGVGAAGKAIADLRRLGVDRTLREVLESGTPLLGICLGAQIVLDRSDEGATRCLGLLPGEVKGFPVPLFSEQEERLKIPHIGWNRVRLVRAHPVLEGIRAEDEFYFVHSYFPVPASEKVIIGRTKYGREFASIIGRGNFIATQFHPEKSGPPGLRILDNFCAWNGAYAE